MYGMVNVIVPLRVIQLNRAVGTAAKVTRIVVDVLDHQMYEPLGTESFADRLREFRQYSGLGIIHYCMNRVETKTVEGILLQPVERVVDEEFTDSAAIGPIEVDSCTPGCVMAIGEKLRGVKMKIIPFWPEVVVHDVQ